MESSYNGPKLLQEDGKYQISLEFVQQMIEWYKDGKSLPRRYVWEIVLGAYDQFLKEDSLVDVRIEEGMTIDVIGDVHGSSRSPRRGRILTHSVIRSILRSSAFVLHDWDTDGQTLSPDERRSCGSWIMVYGSDYHCVCL